MAPTTTGSGLSGIGIATSTARRTTWVNCLGPLGIHLTPVGHGTWKINANNYNAATGVTNGTIVGANATVSGTGCTFTVKGSRPDRVPELDQDPQVKNTAANLTVSGVTGCFGAVNNGDKASFSGKLPAEGHHRRVQPDPHHLALTRHSSTA